MRKYLAATFLMFMVGVSIADDPYYVTNPDGTVNRNQKISQAELRARMQELLRCDADLQRQIDAYQARIDELAAQKAKNVIEEAYLNIVISSITP